MSIKHEEKRKLINLIVQGEAKNTKYILQMPSVRAELIRILGETNGKSASDELLKLAKMADKMDWDDMVSAARGRDMQAGGAAFGGAVDVEWE